MKVLAVVLLITYVSGEAPAPYGASGWRPSGPTFDLPQRGTAQIPQQQEYLPPLDPRRPLRPTNSYGTPEGDVSVLGIPTQEQLPIFQVSPINGQQYVGSTFNSDIQNLNRDYQQAQFQAQQEKARQAARQYQVNTPTNVGANNFPNSQTPRQFDARPNVAPTESTRPDDSRTETSTEHLNLNTGEKLDDDSQKKDKVSVEVTRQNLQEFPPELFLSPLAQLKFASQPQPQLVPLQTLGQIRYLQPVEGESQRQVQGFDGQAQLSALPSVLPQRQVISQPQTFQSGFIQNAALVSRAEDPSYFQQLNQYQPQFQGFPQFQPQPVVLQPQNVNQLQPQYGPPKDVEEVEAKTENQPQFVYQQSYQPQVIYQQYPVQDVNQYPQPEAAYLQNQYPQSQFGLQQVYRGQDALQSGFDPNQQDNGVEKDEKSDANDENDSTATTVSTAFGAGTQPRVYSKYGAPAPGQVNPDRESTTEPVQAEEGPAVAEATAVANGRKKSAKLRSRRLRPVFTVDRSGHLVLAQEQ